MINQSQSRIISVALRSFSTCPRICASHYDVLGITPKATQHDIKSAYYKLSKVHHPDKSDDEESAKKFRALTEAYEVLGNINLKKMYDKGLLVGEQNTTRMDYQPQPEPTDPSLRFYKSRQNRHVAPTMDGRTPIYNFDEWSKNHYGDLLKKSQYNREFIRRKTQNQEQLVQNNHQEVLLYVMFGLGGLFFFFAVNGTTDYDNVHKNIQDIKETSSNK